MIDPVALQMVRDIVTIFGVIAGLAYYITTVKNQSRTRQAQLFMNIYNQSLNNPEWRRASNNVNGMSWSNLDEFLAIIDEDNPENEENIRSLDTLGFFFEGLGVFVKENLIGIRLVALLIFGPIRNLWEKVEPIKDEYREHINYPRWAGETEHLYNELMKYAEKHPELKT